jgi:hypothetical protein
MKCLRIYSTADGESHFDQVEIPTSSRRTALLRMKKDCSSMTNCAVTPKLAVVFDLKEAGP